MPTVLTITPAVADVLTLLPLASVPGPLYPGVSTWPGPLVYIGGNASGAITALTLTPA